MILDTNSNRIYAKATQAIDKFEVKRNEVLTGDVSQLVSFGVDPKDVTEIAKGVGVYA